MKGWWCIICKYINSFIFILFSILIMRDRKNPKLQYGVGFYKHTNATTTLCVHIKRKGGEHYKYYCEMCKKNKITAIVQSPENVKEGDSGSIQSDLSSFLVKTLQVTWHQEGLLSHLCEWVVLDNQACIFFYILCHCPYLYTCSHSLSLRSHRSKPCLLRLV
jgi:hypothetical protein